jgi:gamma-glutamylcyclotransferase (GGCT)/AIG2-like uncharacterized protein YtfP
MHDLLFVYGSLMPSARARFGRGQRDRLAGQSTRVGAAVIEGRLFDLGSYPGLVAGVGEVHGELLRLTSPDATFRWLDPFEGIDPDHPTANDYERTVRPVRQASDGAAVDAWVYLWIKPVAGARVIADGRWAGPE